MNCQHGVNIKHKRCYHCESIAEAEMRGRFFADWHDPVFDGPPDMRDRVKRLMLPISLSVFGHPLTIRVERDCLRPKDGRVFLQIIYTSPCGKTGEAKEWHGRKWYLSTFMTDDEVIKSAYLAFEVAVKHEIMEGFKFHNKEVFNPHVDFKELLNISDREIKRGNTKVQ